MKRISIIVILLALNSPYARAGISEHYETNSLTSVVDKAHELGKVYGQEQVLVVFDIDNTLLATKTNLGSHQWFDWQSHLLAEHQLEGLVATSFLGLLRVQGILFYLGSMRATEPDVVEDVEGLKVMGFPVITLTSRNEETRSATERELTQNGYDFDRSPLGSGFSDNFYPYDLENPDATGLSYSEIDKWDLKEANLASYRRGIFMTSGMHKGAMLRTLLHKTHRSVKAIVFADDQLRHGKNVQVAFEDSEIHVATFRYGHEDRLVEEFHSSEKSEYIRQWNQLKSLINEIF